MTDGHGGIATSAVHACGLASTAALIGKQLVICFTHSLYLGKVQNVHDTASSSQEISTFNPDLEDVHESKIAQLCKLYNFVNMHKFQIPLVREIQRGEKGGGCT